MLDYNSATSPWLDLKQHAEIEYLARKRGWIQPHARLVSIDSPGEGNMNLLARINTDQGSFILKQSRPWVEKYPQIPAPLERIHAEVAFYQLMRQDRLLAAHFPKLIDVVPEKYLVVLEDLGRAADFTFIYRRPHDLSQADIHDLALLLSRLHHHAFSFEQQAGFPQNLALRFLNHKHLFDFPFQENNGLNLDTVQPGLAAAAQPFKEDDLLQIAIRALGQVYLSPGPALLHGDYIPSSWLKTSSGVAVIDPEFCFFGPPEFDLGVMVAHLYLAQVEVELIDDVLNTYQEPPGFDLPLRQAFMGIEILRRIMGIAQLPLTLSVQQKEKLMVHGAEMITWWYKGLPG